MAANSRGQMRPHNASRSPPFLTIGLLVVICILGFNYWNGSNKNSLLTREVTEVSERLRMISMKKLSAEKRNDAILQQLKDSEAAMKKQQELAARQNTECEERAKQLRSKTEEFEKLRIEKKQCDMELEHCNENVTQVTAKLKKTEDSCKEKDEDKEKQDSEKCRNQVDQMRMKILTTIQSILGHKEILMLKQANIDTSGINVRSDGRIGPDQSHTGQASQPGQGQKANKTEEKQKGQEEKINPGQRVLQKPELGTNKKSTATLTGSTKWSDGDAKKQTDRKDQQNVVDKSKQSDKKEASQQQTQQTDKGQKDTGSIKVPDAPMKKPQDKEEVDRGKGKEEQQMGHTDQWGKKPASDKASDKGKPGQSGGPEGKKTGTAQGPEGQVRGQSRRSASPAPVDTQKQVGTPGSSMEQNRLEEASRRGQFEDKGVGVVQGPTVQPWKQVGSPGQTVVDSGKQVGPPMQGVQNVAEPGRQSRHQPMEGRNAAVVKGPSNQPLMQAGPPGRGNVDTQVGRQPRQGPAGVAVVKHPALRGVDERRNPAAGPWQVPNGPPAARRSGSTADSNVNVNLWAKKPAPAGMSLGAVGVQSPQETDDKVGEDDPGMEGNKDAGKGEEGNIIEGQKLGLNDPQDDIGISETGQDYDDTKHLTGKDQEKDTLLKFKKKGPKSIQTEDDTIDRMHQKRDVQGQNSFDRDSPKQDQLQAPNDLT